MSLLFLCINVLVSVCTSQNNVFLQQAVYDEGIPYLEEVLGCHENRVQASPGMLISYALSFMPILFCTLCIEHWTHIPISIHTDPLHSLWEFPRSPTSLRLCEPT